MSSIVEAAITALKDKLGDNSFDGSIRFVIEDEGAIRIDEGGVSESDAEADVTLTADAETFQGILDGEINPAAAVMGGQLSIDGDTAKAMEFGALLS